MAAVMTTDAETAIILSGLLDHLTNLVRAVEERQTYIR